MAVISRRDFPLRHGVLPGTVEGEGQPIATGLAAPIREEGDNCECGVLSECPDPDDGKCYRRD